MEREDEYFFIIIIFKNHNNNLLLSIIFVLHNLQFMSTYKRWTGQKCRNRCSVNPKSKNLTCLVCVNSIYRITVEMNLHGGKDEKTVKSRRNVNHKYICPADFSLTPRLYFFSLSK